MSEYGFLVSLGVALGAAVIHRLAPRAGLSRNQGMDLVFWSVIGGIVGARLLYVALDWNLFYSLCFDPNSVLPEGLSCQQGSGCLPGQVCDGMWCRNVGDCFAFAKFWQGGWVFLGGVIGGIPAGILYLRLKRIAWINGIGLLAIGLPLGHVFGRIGCYFRGCCYGKHGAGWAHGVSMHAVQLYEAVGNVAIFLFVVWRFLQLTQRDEDRGAPRVMSVVLGWYLILYGALRFVTELFRGDAIRGFFFEWHQEWLARLLGVDPDAPLVLSTSQGVSLVMILLGLWLWRRAKTMATNSPVVKQIDSTNPGP